MTNIQWKQVECHLCGTNKLPKPLVLNGKPLVDSQYDLSLDLDSPK